MLSAKKMSTDDMCSRHPKYYGEVEPATTEALRVDRMNTAQKWPLETALSCCPSGYMSSARGQHHAAQIGHKEQH